MNKIRKWLNKPKKEVENQLMIRPLTAERKHQVYQGVTIMGMLSPPPRRLAALVLDVRDLDVGFISQTRTDGADRDLILTTRLKMLREYLQGDISQEEEASDVPQQLHYCPVRLSTTTSAWSRQTSAPLPVWRSQLERVTGNGTQMELRDTGNCAISGLSSAEDRATDTSASSPGPPVRPLLKTRDDCSLLSTPHLGRRRRRLPCSLPCSPLLGGRRWQSPPSSPAPPLGPSRLWVEAALQRSKNIRQTESHPTPPCSPQVRQEGEEDGVSGMWGETGEASEEVEWRDEEEEEDEQANHANIIGIRLSDTIIFRPMTSLSVYGREEEEEESDLLCLDSEMSKYCLLTPCICFRCPSAPPYEAEAFSSGDIQTVSSFSSEDQKHREGLTPPCHRTDVQRSNNQRTDIQQSEGGSEQSLHRDRTPQLGGNSHLYPSLSLWRTTADSQTELNRKQEVNSFDSELDHTIRSCFHDNTDDHLQQLCEMISGELQTLCSADLRFILKKVFDSTTCSKVTARPVQSCSFCSDKLGVQITAHLCRNCDQVFCGRCLCHFSSLLEIHQFSQSEAQTVCRLPNDIS